MARTCAFLNELLDLHTVEQEGRGITAGVSAGRDGGDIPGMGEGKDRAEDGGMRGRGAHAQPIVGASLQVAPPLVDARLHRAHILPRRCRLQYTNTDSGLTAGSGLQAPNTG